MNTRSMHSRYFYLLLILMLFQGASGLFGGAALVIDPSGGLLGLPLDMLVGSPFETYLMPGLILLIVLGAFPLVVCYGLWQRKRWAWWGALLVSIALIIWIGVEIAMVGYHSDPPLQLIYGIVGIVLLILTQLPAVRDFLTSNPVRDETIT